VEHGSVGETNGSTWTKLAPVPLTSLTSGGRLFGIVRSQTHSTEEKKKHVSGFQIEPSGNVLIPEP
jgi:hypothetical protein